MYQKKLFLNSQKYGKTHTKTKSNVFQLYQSINKFHHRFETIKNTRRHINVQAIGLLHVKNKEVNT
jgi:hypothetical protein